MKKRGISLALAMMMAFSLAACGGSATATSGASASGTTAAQESKADAAAPSGAEGSVSDGEQAKLAREKNVNPNAGKGIYPGTSKKNSITSEVTTISVMNPLMMTYNNEFSVARHCWDGLVKMDANNNIVPAAAESWESSDDGMKWTFHLRKDAKWVDSNGKEVAPVTANDFVFGFKELMNPENAAQYYSFATVFKNAQKYYDFTSGASTEEVKFEDVGIKALDDYTLELELENYLPYFLQYIKFEVMAPIYQPFYEKLAKGEYGTAPDKLLYNGPFYMNEWVTENRVTVKKNELWREASLVQPEEINFVKYSDTNTRYNAFLGGELDMMDITGEQREAFKAEDFTVSSYVGGYSYFMWVNTRENSDMRSPSLRKAISAALDRRQLIDTVFKNDNETPTSLALGISGVKTDTFAEAVLAGNGGKSLYNPTSDPAKAKEYLESALKELGYKDASQIKLKIMTSEGTQNELLSQVIQEQLRQNLGIEIGIEVLTITEWRARRNAINFDFCVGGWGPDYNDPLTDIEILESTNGNNHTGYANPEYDKLIVESKQERDLEKREKLFVKCEQMIAEDLPVIPIYWRHEDYVVSEKLKDGYYRMPFQALYFTYTEFAD